MSRFEENLQRDLTVIADRATPSPDAWAQIQSRIADQEPIQETEIIMLTENTTRRRLRPPTDTNRRWPLVAAAAAVVALAITGIALVNRGDGADQPADDPPAPTVAPAPDGAEDATIDQQLDSAVSPLPAEGQALSPGRYAPFTLGFPVEFDVPASTASPWRVQVSNPVTVNVGNDDGFVVFTRIGSFYDAGQAQNPDMTGLGSIPPDDIDGWIEANDVVVLDSREETIDGRTATFRQVAAPPGAGDANELCDAEFRPCLSVASASADLQDTYDGVSTFVFGDNPHSFWFVELDDFEPLAIWASAVGADPDAWSAEIQPLIDSIVLGTPAPATEFGAARLSTFGAGDESTALELPPPGGVIEPGRYASDALGVPIEFDLDVGQTAAWALINEEPGRLWIISQGSDQELLAIGRLGSWYDATEARTADTTGLGSIPADDIDGYIAQNDIIVVDSAEVEVGGRPAAFRQFRLDTTPGATADFCDGSEPCLWASTGSADVVGGTANPLEVGFDRVQTIWLVDMGEFEPVYIFAVAHLGEDGDQQWIDETVQPIIDSMVFGEPAPTVEGGTARVPERVTVSAPFTGVRTNVERLADGSISVVYEATIEGAISGTIAGTDTVVQGVPSTGSGEDMFTGTIEGVGTGTISWTTEWSASAPTDYEGTSIITGGTGDFAGVTGTRVLNLESSNSVDGVDTVTGTETLELVIPRSG